MISLCVFFSVLIGIFGSVFGDPDLTLVFKSRENDNYSINCVMGGNTLETPIFWTQKNGDPVTERSSSHYIPNYYHINFADKYSEEWRRNNWEIGNVSSNLFAAVIDERWEEFDTNKLMETTNIWSGNNFVSASLSVFISNSNMDYRIFIGNVYYVEISSTWITVREKGLSLINRITAQKKLNTTSQLWLHFTISKINDVMKVTFFPNLEQVVWNITKSDNFHFISISQGLNSTKYHVQGFWKLHNYKYLYSKERNEDALQVGEIFNHTGELCITMFVAICNNCSIEIKLIVDENAVKKPYTIKAEKDQTEHYLWKRIYITETNIKVKKKVTLFVRKLNPHKESGFWAISNIRLCKLSEVRVASINRSIRSSVDNINCHTLAGNYSVSGPETLLTDLSCEAGQLGNSCNISCRSIFNEDHCGHKICTSNGCSCSWGLQGEKCNKDCDNSFWGNNCNHTCGNCKDQKVCNRFDGTCPNGCQETYTGARCAGSLPYLLKEPIYKTSYNSIEIEINDTSYNGTISPTRILIQYREEDEKEWKNSTVEYAVQKHNIPDLKSGILYNIRFVLVTENGSLEKEAPVVDVRTTCKDITNNNIVIYPDKFNANLTVKFEDSTWCPLKVYTVELLGTNPRNITDAIHLPIMELSAFTNYTIKFHNTLKNKSIQVSFRTKPTTPEAVSNVTWISSSNNISLAWNPPRMKGEHCNYTIIYELFGHKACDTNNTQNTSVPKILDEIPSEEKDLNNLIPYAFYKISIQAINEAGKGDVKNITVNTTKLDDVSDEEISSTNVEEKNGNIHIIPPSCKEVKGPLNYSINYVYNDSTKCINENKLNKRISYDTSYKDRKIISSEKLIPYSKYLVTVLARRNENSKLVKELQYKSAPSAPTQVRNLMAYSKNKTHVWLRWGASCPLNGRLEKYIINVINTTINKNFTFDTIQTPCIWKDEECVVIENLSGNQNYSFEVRAKNQNVSDIGKEVKIALVTKEEESEPPENFTYKFEEDELSLHWIHPNVTNGPLVAFKIEGYIIDSGSDSAQNISEEYRIEMNQLHYNKKINVTPATIFNISVRGYNTNVGKPSSIRVTIPPPKPELSAPPFISSCSKIICSINIPSAKTCINCSFYLVVTSQKNENKTSPFLNTAFGEKIFKNKENTEILQYYHWIETEKRFDDVKRDTIETVNATFNNSNYLLSIILVSSYKGQYVTKTYRFNYRIETSKVNGLYYLLLLLVIPLAVLSFLILRFLKKKGEESTDEQMPNNANSLFKKKPEIKPEDTLPLVTLPPKPKILKENKHKYSRIIELNDLKSYLNEAAEGGPSHNLLSKQHEMCMSGYIKPIEIGSMEINKKKNRYKNLIAYDHTRVKLKNTDENGSDYINANYIDGYNTKKAYIATQGPTASTLNDFWYMIWEQNVGNIVMLANVIESGKKKCEEYWPASTRTMSFKEILVQNIKTKVFPSYIYRELQLTYKGNKRIVNQLHFTLWPDHGVPLYPQDLMPFVKEILKIPVGKHPIVVHCSAGIGRTGTILLCDIVLRMAAFEKRVDFFKVYHQLREQRPNMVDNPTQYTLAHLVVYECIFEKDFSIPLDIHFKDKIKDLLTEVQIKSMIDYLDEVSWQIKIMQECFENKLSYLNKRKNRFPTILPGRSQIYLERYPQDEESSDYINAVSMDCFQNQDRFIVTQQPLPNTVGDFWRLILQYDVNTIISLNEIQQEDRTSCIFWPMRKEAFYPVDYIKVAHLREEDRGDFSLITIALTDENEDKRISINIICLNGWMPGEVVPAELNGLLAVRNHMFNTTFGHENPIVVTCYDGATASGLFVALSFLIEKIKLEHSCDVVLAVGSVRQKRMQCVRDKEQFKFLLKAALLYSESFDTYSNFNNL